MKSAADVKVDQAGNVVVPVGADLSGKSVHIAFDVEPAKADVYDDPDIIPATEPVEGEAYAALLTRLYGCWDGDLFEPLDEPLRELGHWYDDEEKGAAEALDADGRPS